MIEQSGADILDPLAIARLTFIEIEQEIARFPALVLPLGGCEPYARFGTLGVASAVAKALARELSRRMRMLCAPVLPLGCSTSFMSFGGTAGVKTRTMTNVLCEAVRMWYFQGIKTVVIVDALLDNREAVDLARKRLAASHPGNETIVFALQRDARVLDFIKKSLPGDEAYRAEFAMLSMAAWIDPGLVRGANASGKPWSGSLERVRTWRKRGGDPEQFRKIAPDCSCSKAAQGYKAEFGRELFEFIVELMEQEAGRAIREPRS
jgi:creatinine amidohydrolase/Fe(II)-dependent formamide hydrolase-like protein